MRVFETIFLGSLLLIGWGRITLSLSPVLSMNTAGTTTSVIIPLMLVYLFTKRPWKNNSFHISPTSPLFIVCVYCLISLVWTKPFDFFFFNTVIVPSFLAYGMLRDLVHQDPAFWPTRCLPCIILSTLLIVLRGLIDSPGTLINEGKLDTPFDHHTLVAMNLLFLIPLAMERIVSDEKKRLTYGIYLVLMILSVVMCGSRVGLVVLFFVLFLSLLAFAGQQIRMIGAAAIVFSIIFLYAMPMTHQRFVGLLSLGDDPYMITRTRIWDMTFVLLQDHLLLGYGFSQKTFLAAGIARYTEPVFFYEHPHNLFIQILAYLGIVGLMLFLWLCFDIGTKIWRLGRSGTDAASFARALAVSFLGFLLMNLVEGALNSGRMMLNLFLVLALLDHFCKTLKIQGISLDISFREVVGRCKQLF